MYFIINRKNNVVEGFDLNKSWLFNRLGYPYKLKIKKMTEKNSPQVIGHKFERKKNVLRFE